MGRAARRLAHHRAESRGVRAWIDARSSIEISNVLIAVALATRHAGSITLLLEAVDEFLAPGLARLRHVDCNVQCGLVVGQFQINFRTVFEK